MSTTARDVLDFWFAEANMEHWFDADTAFDEKVRGRLGHALDPAAAGQLDDWAVTPAGWLALLILLDQCPRDLYRGEPRAWAQDVKAQRLVLSGLLRGDDRRLPPLQRVFAYMPLEHAENMELQQRSVEQFEALCAEVPLEQRERFDGFLDYARRHREVIARFGRFPHRNAALGRGSTPEEVLYLAQPDAGF
ncbi:hypothetical protein B0E46_04450 [Rhodanobacter sp. B04]|uniref:DUF924 family protein n=1 Tax=Rhodanobacter sp. B04 TaxID=1945860 RepID=UPI000987D61B|nr:DUF924 family protein [Rhodanobacter sp. B04]OOG65675.1 hypothetical protein B0E46_04450 [Rhodanobacter sp. B04]